MHCVSIRWRCVAVVWRRPRQIVLERHGVQGRREEAGGARQGAQAAVMPRNFGHGRAQGQCADWGQLPAAMPVPEDKQAVQGAARRAWVHLPHRAGTPAARCAAAWQWQLGSCHQQCAAGAAFELTCRSPAVLRSFTLSVAYSPDGRRLVAGGEPGSVAAVYAVAAAGSRATRLRRCAQAWHHCPD